MGENALILHTDQYGKAYQFTYSPGDQHATSFAFHDRQVKAQEIKGFWNRKYAAPYSFEVEQNPADAPYLREAHLLLFGYLNTTPAFCLDRLSDAIIAENKSLQLHIAKEIGLDIPDTIFSNNPVEILQFLDAHHGEIVVKMQGVLSWSMTGKSDFFYTRRVSRRDLENSPVLSIYPLIYQQLIKKEFELRIIYVDGQCFCGKIPGLGEETIDWRKPGVQFQWEKGSLPLSIQSKLMALMDQLNLKFGAIDLIKSQDGKYYFLEINPTGEWGMLEKDLNLPISEQIAKTLVKYS